MREINHEQYKKLVKEVEESFPCWEFFHEKTIFISGASGMIGSLLIDVIMEHNASLSPDMKCKVLATSRSEKTAKELFKEWFGQAEFTYFAHDITEPLPVLAKKPDLLIHAASTTHPIQYISEPINTITSNLWGCRNMLESASQQSGSRMLLLSSVEIYGENRGDVDSFDESYCGYLNCNTLRAGYPEAKRVSEALCQAYIKERNVDAVILRLPRIYGPTMRMNDSKASSQFIKKAIDGDNIVLKSAGSQVYSYAFVADAILGILWVLAYGKKGEAYNLADSSSNITLKELAELIASLAGTQVVFELPDGAEKAGYSTATKAILDAGKLKKLGWFAQYDLQTGLRLTLNLLNGVHEKNPA